jgi:4-hydroxy-tetrahydrodipicolinate synthase
VCAAVAMTPRSSPLEPHGLFAAVSTAVTAKARPDVARCKEHWRSVIAAGAHGICPFGTTGEGVAFSRDTKIAVLNAIASDIAPSKMMPVVGACALEDAIVLVSHACEIGCPAVLVTPPFFYKMPCEDGVYAFYASLIDAVANSRLQIFLYNIPQLTGVVIEHAVVRRLRSAYREAVIGIKDSCGKLEWTLAYIREFPDLAVFTGTDHHIVDTLRAGGGGAVTGMGNINPRALRGVFDHYNESAGVELCRTAGEIHLVVEKYGGVPAMKSVIAHYSRDAQWAHVTAPLTTLPPERQRSLIAELEAAGFSWPLSTSG